MSKLALYGIILLAIAGWSAGLVAYGHHKGYESGQQAGHDEALQAQIKQHAAEAGEATLAASLSQANAAIEKMQAAAETAINTARLAAQKAKAIQLQADKDAAAFVAQLQKATSLPECQGLKEQICSSAYPY